MADRICKCGNQIEQSAIGKPRKYCTTCRPVRNWRSEKQCGEPGCSSKVIGRGLCPTHYSAWRRAQLRYTITCPACGVVAQVQRKTIKHCSYQCGMDAVNANKAGVTVNDWRNRPDEMKISRYKRRAQARANKAARGTRGRTIWISRTCKICPNKFIIQSSSTELCCSPECTKVNRKNKSCDKKARRRARKRGANVTPVRRLAIFQRDNYRCHICKRLTNPKKCAPHPRSPTIDHLIPLAKGGTHEPANVATACFECNCLKRELGGGEQLALIG